MALNLSQKFPVKTNPTFTLRKASSSTFEIVLLLIVISLFYFFMIQPKMAELDAAKTEFQTAKSEQETIQQNNKKLQDALKAFSRHKDDVAKLDEALPLDTRTPKVYMLIESMVERSGLNLGEISVTGGTDGVMAGNTQLITDPFGSTRTLQKMNVSLSATGNFEQFLALLKYLETSGRIFDISTLDISAGEGDKLSFNTQLITYYYE